MYFTSLALLLLLSRGGYGSLAAPCPAGFFCPDGISDPYRNPCSILGPTVYCPPGSSEPLPVPAGFYPSYADESSVWAGYADIKPCEPGYYCSGGAKYACPAGTFGSLWMASNHTSCQVCPAGYACTEGSSSGQPCGGNALYCPEGTASALQVAAGNFSFGGDAHTRHSSRLCPPGSWCMEGIQRLCPGGYYGDAEGMSSPECSGKCEPGFFCPEGSAVSTQFSCESVGTRFYCPEGSAFPLPLGDGHYLNTARSQQLPCPPGHFCDADGVVRRCPVGVYGEAWRLSNDSCSGPCVNGFECPEGSTSPRQGSYTIPQAPPGYFYSPKEDEFYIAPPGFYADRGVLYRCMAGSYGSKSGASTSSCSGKCHEGFTCLSGSTSPTQNACGIGNLCPSGSVVPVPVSKGHYTTSYGNGEAPCPHGHFRNISAASDPTSGMSSVVSTELLLAPCSLCPSGTFKAEDGDEESLCRPCEPYTSLSVPERTHCDCYRLAGGSLEWERLYFNTTSASCTSVPLEFLEPAPPTYFGTSFAAIRETRCTPGTYCHGGVRYNCPAGTYGSTAGLATVSCDGLCAAGFYCPEGSVSDMQIPCGEVDLYCPEGSEVPLRCPAGNYTVPEGDNIPRNAVKPCKAGHWCPGDGLYYPCPAGSFGATEGLELRSDCVDCPEGYFCVEGSVTPQVCGGEAWFCPGSASEPQAALPGYYTLNSWTTEESTRSLQVLCAPGTFCRGGVSQPCPPGTWSSDYGLSDVSECTVCPAGNFCVGGSALPQLCQSADSFCSAGSAEPVPVRAGYYTIPASGQEGLEKYVEQKICEPGYWCRGGRRFPCRGGIYGATAGLRSPDCSGTCPPGYACMEGCSVPVACNVGEYAPAGSPQCIKCPVSPEGVTQGACKDHRLCCE